MSQDTYKELKDGVGKKFDRYIHDFKPTQFNECDPINFVRNFKDLPTELRSKIQLIMKYKPINMGGCYYNSLYLSSIE